MPANAELTANGHSSMTSSSLALAAVLMDELTGAGGNSESLGIELLHRATRDDYDRWLATALAAGGCVRPVRLRGTVREVDTTTGEIVDGLDTEDLPDKAIYVPCGDRRASVCPPCAETYRADTPAIGDHVPAGGSLLSVYGPRQLPERQLRRGVLLGDERTLDDDPAFAIRMLVDVAIKALSPAVNDPTTAVQSLDRIEDLLRYAAPKDLSVGTVTDSHGAVRFVYPTPTWDDLVELALDEIRAFGAGQYQVARRLRALLDALIADVPEKRRPPLIGQGTLLDDAVSSAITQSQRADALVPDRQGIGMSHRTSIDGH